LAIDKPRPLQCSPPDGWTEKVGEQGHVFVSPDKDGAMMAITKTDIPNAMTPEQAASEGLDRSIKKMILGKKRFETKKI